MKKTSILLLLIFVCSGVFAQDQKLKIYTKKDEAKFRVYLDGVKQNNFFQDEFEFDIDTTTVEMRLSFADSTAADIIKNVVFLEGQKRIFEVKMKPGLIRKISKTGRKIGKKTEMDEHQLEGEVYDIFYLKDRTKETFFEN